MKGISERPRKRKAPARILCYCCGESGHFKRSCPLRTSVCPICGKTGHTESTCWQIVRECFCCGEKGHLKASCPYRYQSCEACGKDGHTRATCWRKSKECFSCHKEGHLSKVCPMKQRVEDERLCDVVVRWMSIAVETAARQYLKVWDSNMTQALCQQDFQKLVSSCSNIVAETFASGALRDAVIQSLHMDVG